MATEPTRNNWDSVDDGLRAEAAAAGDVESVPSDAEKGEGHKQNTGYTSGRANYLWAMVSEWFQKVRDVLLPQHGDSGGHENVTITGTSGATKCKITSTSGESAYTKTLEIVDADGAYGAWITKEGSAYLNGGTVIGDFGAGRPSAVKLMIFATNTDTASLYQMMLYDASSSLVFALMTDGTIVTGMPSFDLALAPGMFHAVVLNGGQTDTATVYELEGSVYNGQMNIADSNTRAITCPETRFVSGDTITAVTLYADRNTGSGTITLRLRNKHAYNGIAEVGSATINSGTGDQTATLSGLSHTVADPRGYYWQVEMNNAGVANDIEFQFVKISITRTRIR